MITAARPAAGSTIQRFNFIRSLSFLGLTNTSIVPDPDEKRVRARQEVGETSNPAGRNALRNRIERVSGPADGEKQGGRAHAGTQTVDGWARGRDGRRHLPTGGPRQRGERARLTPAD